MGIYVSLFIHPSIRLTRQYIEPNERMNFVLLADDLIFKLKNFIE